MCCGVAALLCGAVTHVPRCCAAAESSCHPCAARLRERAGRSRHAEIRSGAAARSSRDQKMCSLALADRHAAMPPRSPRRFPRSPAVAPPLAARPPRQKSAAPRQKGRAPQQKSVVFRGDPLSGAGEADFRGKMRGARATRGDRGARDARGGRGRGTRAWRRHRRGGQGERAGERTRCSGARSSNSPPEMQGLGTLEWSEAVRSG